MSTITAISTPAGTGGIAVIRISGPQALTIADSVWRGARLTDAKSHTAHLGSIVLEDGSPLDQAVATIFRAPHSFTGEDTVEFSVHGSIWIQRELIKLLCRHGAEPAGRGEFSRRAFMNGRLDLAQAEAVADMIAASSRAAHRLAVTQMSGDFSRRLDDLRQQLIKLASLLELELDFSEEEVEFADRHQLIGLTGQTISYIRKLTSTYEAGRAIKEGVPVAIAGAPNAGKSTLLNVLLDEEKAIVSDIPGTTRDVIEDTCEIGGVLFRLYDTAGLRHTDDAVEKIGVDRARRVIDRAGIVLWLLDVTVPGSEERMDEIKESVKANPQATHMLLLTKADKLTDTAGRGGGDLSTVSRREDYKQDAGLHYDCLHDDGLHDDCLHDDCLYDDCLHDDCLHDDCLHDDCLHENTQDLYRVLNISSKTGEGIKELKETLVKAAKRGLENEAEIVITNARHQAALTAGAEALERAKAGIETGLSADLIAQDIREALDHISQVTGQITTPDLLTSIFSTFCIGK